MSKSLSALGLVAAALVAGGADAQTFGTDFATDYSFVDLGPVPGVPTPYGGIDFVAGDPDTIWIGGAANVSTGTVYAIGVTRDPGGHVNGFTGTSTTVFAAPYIDGGLDLGPGNVTFFTGYPVHTLEQVMAGSSGPDKTIDSAALGALGILSSLGAIVFVPPGFAGAGHLKIASFNASTWHDAQVSPDGSGTYDLVNVGPAIQITGGVEGIVYIAAGNPGFSADSVLVCEWSVGRVGAYDIDGAGDPIPATRRDFMSSLSGAEGAVIDPITGDFLFSTFGAGGGDHVIVVSGFTEPTVYCAGKLGSTGCVPTIAWTGDPTVTGPDDFVVDGGDLPNNVPGALFWSLGPATTPVWGGTLCLAAQVRVLPVGFTAGTPGGRATDCTGTLSQALTQAFFSTQGIGAGTRAYVQYLARDPGYPRPTAVALSDALTFQVLP